MRGIDVGPERTLPFAGLNVSPEEPCVWAGHTRFQVHADAAIAVPKLPESQQQVTLHFQSCTTFRLNAPDGFKANLPLPLPRHVFQSWLGQWDALAPSPVPISLASLLEHYVWVIDHAIRMETAAFASTTKGAAVGFSGRVTFGAARRDDLSSEIWAEWRYVDALCVLAAFGYFAGPGWRTSHGLGQTLPLAFRKGG
ncbi:CRISPR system precrRNA processing endoribonuclease RAMP protein Cas6 [Aggregatilinea lenta]|uniref:CRISPR system precrRNA processing endoribonuclease RAMP protein Cas6 n=1 Tax=Aggregatilinea lenta TaxID=913108 RepID=UPI000E5A3885|nr:CRISPR system precrRNA processing endoribonuclease RAMP protein Cas6 [Aggregatilinea lenta]